MSSEGLAAIGNIPFGQVEALARTLGLNNFALDMRRNTASTYDQFIEVLYEDIDELVSYIQENPELRKDDSEDRLSIELVGMLRSKGYNASHEAKHGGHCDILVKGRGNFTWIGEAKIHSSYDYLFKGFQQLCTRYSTGDYGQSEGGIIIYIKNKDSASVILRWRESLSEKNVNELAFIESTTRPDFVFYTTHKHERSGIEFKVRHIGVILSFSPEDRG